MKINLKQAKWEIFRKRKALLLYFGIKTGLVNLYDDELIEKLRDIMVVFQHQLFYYV